MKILVVDDERKARETILEVIRLYCPQVMETREADGVKSALDVLHGYQPDLLLLDIHLKDGSGFDLLKHIAGSELPVIFITAYEEYAIRAFRVSALDYLLKPIDPDEFIAAIQRAQQKLEKSKLGERIELLMQNITSPRTDERKLALKTADSIHVVRIADILYCEADRNYTTFFLIDKRKIVVSRSLGEFEDILPAESFVRIHQSFIVNASHVTRYDKGDGGFVHTVNDHKLPVATRRKELLLQFLQKL